MARALTPEVVAEICAHMNDDHADSVAAYVRAYAAIPGAGAARMVGLDTGGMDIIVGVDGGEVTARVPFDHPVKDAEDARRTLIAMAQRADAVDRR